MRFLGPALFTSASVGVLALNAHPVSSPTNPPAIPTAEPHWTAAHAHEFPGCVGTGSFLPSRIVVVARRGEARTMPYTEATIARIDATWRTADVWDDLYTIGRCAR